ncbi:MAG: type IV toxin-antitoxin system AbiEi family antitoxin domain-containing protein [Elusimicrobiales bacterium]
MFSENLIKLSVLYNKPYFFTEDVAKVLDISIESARVFVTRQSKKEIFIKLKKNCYSFEQRWGLNKEEDFFAISSILRVPSYISLLTALSYYGVTTQVPQDRFESITILSTKNYEIKDKNFKFYKVKGEFFNGFLKKDNYFIAEKEKAFIDAIYLYSFGKYSLDLSSIDIKKLDKSLIFKIAKKYPQKTIEVVKRICKI